MLIPLPRRVDGATTTARQSGGLASAAAAAVRDPAVWRLMLLFMAANGLGLVLGSWLIQYPVQHGGQRRWLAGALGFALFGVTAIMRRAGGSFAESGPRGWPQSARC